MNNKTYTSITPNPTALAAPRSVNLLDYASDCISPDKPLLDPTQVGNRRINKVAYEKQLQRYIDAYGCSLAEAMELYEFDFYHTDTDEEAEAWLAEHTDIEHKQLSESFSKPAAKPVHVKITRGAIDAAALAERNAARLNYLAGSLVGNYPFLFGDSFTVVSAAETSFVAPNGDHLSIKLSKHREQKVFSKPMQRRKKRQADGTMGVAPLTENQYRQLAIESTMRLSDLFESVAAANSQFGFPTRNEKFPFCSLKLTVHRS